MISRIGPPLLVRSLIKSYSQAYFITKFLFVFLALCLFAHLILHIEGFRKYKLFAKGADVIIALDVSNSMLCTDIKPSRFIRAKSLVNTLIGRQGNNRFGLISFADKALLQMPITTDSSELRIIANGISLTDFNGSGTNIGTALQLANVSLNTKEKRVKKVILISDGEAHDSLSTTIAEMLSKKSISVFTVGVGTSSGDRIMIDNSNSYLTDLTGKEVVTKLDETLLRNIAKTTDGKYYSLEDEKVVTEDILSNIEESYTTDGGSMDKTNFGILSFLLLITILLLLIVEILIPEGRKSLSL